MNPSTSTDTGRRENTPVSGAILPRISGGFRPDLWPASRIIAPSLLAADFGKLEHDILDMKRSGADWLHVDIMDGNFVPPITFGDNMIALAKRVCDLPLDVHLMIASPNKHLQSFAEAGANVITVHKEACNHLHGTLRAIRSLGCASGVSVKPATPVESIYDVLDVADIVLVMTVEPGWGGQAFIPETLDKIRALKAEIDRLGLPTRIEVDGGINLKTIEDCAAAGASIFVAGSAVFKSPDRAGMIAQFR